MKTPGVQKINSSTKWEDQVGYSRAIKVGNVIEISGTTASGKDEYEQTCEIVEKAKSALATFDADLSHVIRTRMYCTNIKNWEAIGKAHAHYFSRIRPVTSMVEVSALIDPELLVEIEFTAFILD